MGYFELLSDAWPMLLNGAKLTIVLTVCSLLVGLVLGLVLAMMRISTIRWVTWVGHGYVDLIRGTPLLVQLFLIYYGLPQFGIRLEPLVAATIALGGNYGAYLAEVFRSGLLSVDRGQWEAGASLGFSRGALLRRIVLPQATRIALPGIGNYANSMVKDTSLASVVTVGELLRQGQLVVAQTFQSFEIYLTVALMYLVISIPISVLTKKLERRSSRGYA